MNTDDADVRSPGDHDREAVAEVLIHLDGKERWGRIVFTAKAVELIGSMKEAVTHPLPDQPGQASTG